MKPEIEHVFFADRFPRGAYAQAYTLHIDGMLRDALDMIDVHLRDHPDDIRAHTKKAQILRDMDRKDDAAKHLDSSWSPKTASPDMKLVMAIQYSQVGIGDRALALLKQAEREGVIRGDLCYAKAIVMHTLTIAGHKGLIDEAADCIREASKLDNGRVAIESAVANILLSKYYHSATKDQDLLKLVVRHAERSIQIGDDDYLTYYNIGRAYFFMKRPERALPYLEEAAKRRPWFVDIQAMIGSAMAERDGMTKGYYRKAIDIIDYALDKDPSILFALQSKVSAYDILGDEDGVRATITTMTKRDPSSADPWGMLACIYLAEGNESKAEACIDSIRKHHPKTPPTRVVFKHMRRVNYDWRRFFITDMLQ